MQCKTLMLSNVLLHLALKVRLSFYLKLVPNSCSPTKNAKPIEELLHKIANIRTNCERVECLFYSRGIMLKHFQTIWALKAHWHWDAEEIIPEHTKPMYKKCFENFFLLSQNCPTTRIRLSDNFFSFDFQAISKPCARKICLDIGQEMDVPKAVMRQVGNTTCKAPCNKSVSVCSFWGPHENNKHSILYIFIYVLCHMKPQPKSIVNAIVFQKQRSSPS